MLRTRGARNDATVQCGIRLAPLWQDCVTLVAGLLIVIFGDQSLHAQTSPISSIAPSQVTPRSLLPTTRREEPKPPTAKAPGEDPPSAAAILHFFVGKVLIEGGFEERASQDARLAATIEGRRVSVAEIYHFASDLEDAYAQSGFILARVTLPPQRLVDNGPLRFVVIDGYIESVDYSHVPERVRALVKGRIERLVGRKRMTRGDIERALLLAGDAPGLYLKSAFGRGASDGGTILTLEGAHRLTEGGIGPSNRYPQSLGVWSQQASLSLNSPFDLGEQLYVSGVADVFPGDVRASGSRMRVLGGGAILPLDEEGVWTLNPEIANSWTRPRAGASAPQTVGRFWRARLASNHRLIRTRRQNLTAALAVERVSQHLVATEFDAGLSQDAYLVLRGSLSGEEGLSEAHIVQVGLQLSQGLGGRNAAEAARSGVPLSHQGASPVFTKLDLEARDTLALPENFMLTTAAQGQTSFGSALLRPEQFSLDGSNALSSYSNGAFSVDEGVLVRVELSRARMLPDTPLLSAVTPYWFAAAGYGVIRSRTAVEPEQIVAAAAGFGARANLGAPEGFESVLLALEFAKQVSGVPGRSRGWRGNIGASLRF